MFIKQFIAHKKMFTFIMKIKNFLLILSLIFFMTFIIYTFKKPFIKIQNKEKDYLNQNYSRDLEEKNEYDTYIILYFKQNCSYSSGFYNYYRNGISFIINRENNTKIKRNELLMINKDFGIEIHFNVYVENLNNFFSRSIDYNMVYLESIDFSNFDSSLVTNM